jgi:hypothetical protein
MRYLILLILLSGCSVMDLSKARAIKKIGKLQARQERLAEKYDIGTKDTVIFRDTIITGGYKTDTLIQWRFDVDTIYSAPNEVIKWRIARSKVDSIYVPYSVSIDCPTDTTYISVKIPCPEIKISRWEKVYSKVFLTLRTWWRWLIALIIIIGTIYLLVRFWRNIKPYLPFI